MTTLTPPAAPVPPAPTPSVDASSRRRALRTLTLVGVTVSVVGLGACSSNADGDAATSAAPTAGTSAPSTSASTPSTPATSTSTSTSTAPPAQVNKAVKVTITDEVLGHKITTKTLARNVPWPAGNPVAAESFEIVGVWVTVEAGDRYSADVQPSMFTLKAGSAPAVKATGEFGKKFGRALATTKRAKKNSGWLFFKMDRGAGPDLKLVFNRPTYQVSTTDKKIKADAISKALS